MSRRKPAASNRTHSATTRRLIAGAAARLMAEGGITDYGMAKRKAARQIGIDEGDALPSNDEVESELRAYQAIFQDDEQPQQLRELRLAALEVMDRLREFRPCLTGAVLDGTAGRFSSVELDLFADSSKDVEIMLLSNNIPYEVDEIQHRFPDSPETRLALDWDGIPVHLLIYPPGAERSASRKAGSRSRPRARAADVAALLANPEPLPEPGT